MASLVICSWNVNGLRASLASGAFQAWLASTSPDIAGLQEVKAHPDQVQERAWAEMGYHETWKPSDRPGYSGALLLSKPEPVEVRATVGNALLDGEGRLIEADYDGFTLISCYFPNAGRKLERLDYKLAFYDAFLDHVTALRDSGRDVVFMGDLNVAHTEIDLARPEENRNTTGFLEVERAWVDRLIERGWRDTFRALHPGARGAYTFWDPWRRRRERNVGWRIDYVFVNEELLPRVRRAFIQPEVMSSDHCPVGIELEVEAAFPHGSSVLGLELVRGVAQPG